ncbi:TetR/AcrR family transcriptional regulator [Streptomyces sp. NPDC102259]|uniref:TetR/AcrR family transcriptional regulator n=1 Tax=Streptomyces sp. NPDC102259 TaxID=3366148 RepID=UPI00382111FA
MPEGALLAEQIIDAAEQALRRFGPRKATVMDTARILRVSHGSIYRHFPDRDALREAVIERWLVRLRDTLPAGQGHHPAAWLDALYAAHQDAARTDPELHAAYAHLFAYSTVVSRHHHALATTLAGLLEAGPAPAWAHDHLHAATTGLTALTAFLDPRLTPAAVSSAESFTAARDLVTAGLTAN